MILLYIQTILHDKFINKFIVSMGNAQVFHFVKSVFWSFSAFTLLWKTIEPYILVQKKVCRITAKDRSEEWLLLVNNMLSLQLVQFTKCISQTEILGPNTFTKKYYHWKVFTIFPL